MTSDTYYISSGGQTFQSHGIALFTKNQALNCIFKKTTSQWWVLDDSVQQNVWYHVVVTWDMNTGARMYRDALLVAEVPMASTAAYIPQNYNTLELGRQNNGLNTALTHGEGYIDELYLCEDILEESDIVYLYLSYFR